MLQGTDRGLRSSVDWTLILIYLIIIFVVYLTREKVTPYEVVSGSLSGNYRYSALALKSEQVVQAQESGAVTYYAREGSNVGSGELICSVGGQADESGRKASIQTSLSNEDLTSVKSMLSTYSANSGPNDFSSVCPATVAFKLVCVSLNASLLARNRLSAGLSSS